MDTLALCLGGGLVIAAVAHAIIGVRGVRYTELQKSRALAAANRQHRTSW